MKLREQGTLWTFTNNQDFNCAKTIVLSYISNPEYCKVLHGFSKLSNK